MPHHQIVPTDAVKTVGAPIMLDLEGIQEQLIENSHDFATLTLADFTEPHLARMSTLLAEMSSQVAQAQASRRMTA